MTDSNMRGPELSRAGFLRLVGAGMATLGAAAVTGRPVLAASGMRTRPIPSSGEALPVVGLGTWQTFDVRLDTYSRVRLTAVLRNLFAAGGSVIDSSPMYGRSEAVVGELLSAMGAHDKAFVATKVWTRGREAGIRQMEQSERRLRDDHIDLMQVHNLVDLDTQLATLKEWKAAGRIRYIGVTHWTESALDDLVAVMRREPVDFVQLAYSLDIRAAEERALPEAADRGVAVLVNRPFGKGRIFQEVKGRPLPDWAGAFGASSWAQLFLKFILSHPAVTCAIPGTGEPDHMADNAAAGTGSLPDAAERRRIVDFWESL